MKSCAIIAAMPQILPPLSDCFIIAADGGLCNMDDKELSPNLVVGDWDSSARPNGVECIDLPHEKDDTDTHFAAKWAVEHGFREVFIYGGIGGRLDHTIANLHTLFYLKQQGVSAALYGEGAEAHILTQKEHSCIIPKREGWYLSLFPFSGIAEGVTVKGAYYEVENGTLTADFPVGISNEFSAETVSISLTKGNLLILQIKK